MALNYSAVNVTGEHIAVTSCEYFEAFILKRGLISNQCQVSLPVNHWVACYIIESALDHYNVKLFIIKTRNKTNLLWFQNIFHLCG